MPAFSPRFGPDRPILPHLAPASCRGDSTLPPAPNSGAIKHPMSRKYPSNFAAGWIGLSLAACFGGPFQAAAAPIISEFMASNEGTLLDEDGESPDWLEIYNPDATVADLSGWHLTDNAANPTKWTFPAGVSLGPREFLVVWASSKNRRTDPAKLHTNFSLNAGGEYLALVAPDGATRPGEFAPTFPPQEPDESFGVPFSTTNLLSAGAASSALVPPDGSLGQSWTQPGFVPGAGWIHGPTHLGFGVPTPGFFIEEKLSPTALTSITTAETLLNDISAVGLLTGVTPAVNFTGDTGGDGRFGDGLPVLHGGDQSNFAMRATATLVIPTAGAWTFCVNSDEGFRLRIDNISVSSVAGLRAPADSLVTRSLTAGNHTIVLTYFENSGGDEVELSAAQGTHTSFSSLFKLVGDTANGGLPVLTPTGSGQPIVATDLGAVMMNVNASAYLRVPFTVANPAGLDTLDLTMTYNDGFIAYLNGTEVARQNAPAAAGYNAAATAARPILTSLQPVRISLSEFLPALPAGTNLLAIHGLNTSAADNSFLVAPQISASIRLPGPDRYFRKATPGSPNTTSGFLGHVGDTSFSPKRGVYTAPVSVAITTATSGATIRYTTNGSTPTELNGTIYQGPIPVDKTMVLRAAAFRDGYEPTNVDTHTYLFFNDVMLQGGPVSPFHAKPGPEWPNHGTIGGQIIDYGMDRTIVNHTNATLGGQAALSTALAALPSVCLTTDVPNLFHTTTGIYTHASSHGSTWERPASVEMIGDPNTPEGGFHSSCGIRIRGGYSRSGDNPKHSFRVFFRSDYGPSKLDYPIYGTAGASEFDTFDIQCSQNYSWSFGGDASHNALREIWSRDTQLAVGQLASHGRFVHLYLNGVYWGLYQIEERKEAAFGATYLGGSKDDYDVIKHTGSSGGYTTEATDGDFVTTPAGTDSAWKKLWTASRAAYFINKDKNPASPAASLISTPEQKLAAYYKLAGLQADGKTPAGGPALLDIGNLIDYIIILFFTKNTDSGISAFLSNAQPNNFYALRDRTGNLGFMSLLHDAEHSLNAGSAGDRWGPWQTDTSSFWNGINYSNPQYFHQDLTASPEYRLRFADHLYRHFFNNGPMTAANNQARLDLRSRQVEPAIIAESARWGDAKTSPARNASNWRTARTDTRNWFTNRSTQFISEARTRGFYPTIEPPSFNQRGGAVPPGFNVILTNPNAAGGTIYYTTDGSDPRMAGGGFTPSVLIPEFSNASYFVPSETNGGSTMAIASWTGPAAPSNEASWLSGQMGFGFNPINRPATTNFTPFIKTNVLQAMQPAGGTPNGTLYVRLPFTLAQTQIDSFESFRLRVRYDDAFIAYLNGQEIVRKTVNAGFVPLWNSSSLVSHADTAGVIEEEILVPNFKNRLVAGSNLLAFHVMNQSATETDLLFSPQVLADSFTGTSGKVYTGPITLTAGAVVKSRVLTGMTWSALQEATFYTDTVPASAANLVVSEFSYNPSGPQTAGESAYASSDFEFIELQNISQARVDLFNVALSGAVSRMLGTSVQQWVLEPGGRLIVAANPAAFTQRYGLLQPVMGPFDGSMDNSGETIRITAANGLVIKEFSYASTDPWPKAADGDGFSLVLLNPTANPPHGDPASWRSSAAQHGNPAAPKGTTYTAWKALEGDPGDEADPDGDGLNTFVEYALGGRPALPDPQALPVAGIASFTVGGTTGDYLTLTFRRRLMADDIVYGVESSSDLTSGNWTAGGVTPASETNHGDGTATMVLRSLQPFTSAQRLYLRLRLTTR